MKFHSKPVEEHIEVPLPDEGRWESIINESSPVQPAAGAPNACYVVSVGKWTSDVERDAQLAEILGLVEAQGDTVVGHETYRLNKPNPRTVIGVGAGEAIAERARASNANLVVIDAELSPSQMRNLEGLVGMSVSDREAVILNVFLKHAHTRRARIQVEMAHLEYLRPRIRGIGLDMDQQAGGVMRGPGRGPGETASELLARHMDRRLAELRKAFDRLERAEATQRRSRETSKRISLVGYTNAGKTSLMNALTGAGLSARDAPFETLDTTSRALTRHGGDVLISDTVGFIRRLPQRLFESFSTTLAEIREASLLAVVVDAADPEWTTHLATIEDMLQRLDASAVPRFYVFNKADKLAFAPSPARVRELCGAHDYRVLSSQDAAAVDELREALITAVRSEQRVTTVVVPYHLSEVMSEVYGRCRVLESEAEANGLRVTIQGLPHVVARVESACEEVTR